MLVKWSAPYMLDRSLGDPISSFFFNLMMIFYLHLGRYDRGLQTRRKYKKAASLQNTRYTTKQEKISFFRKREKTVFKWFCYRRRHCKKLSYP